MAAGAFSYLGGRDGRDYKVQGPHILALPILVIGRRYIICAPQIEGILSLTRAPRDSHDLLSAERAGE